MVERFRTLLRDHDAFEEARRSAGVGRETVWQRFLEENPWILGVGLAGQLLTSWDDARLEQVVSGFSVAGPGKRTDALMRTTGRIRSLVFTEIKHHETALLSASEYRPGCWPPSADLAGGVTNFSRRLIWRLMPSESVFPTPMKREPKPVRRLVDTPKVFPDPRPAQRASRSSGRARLEVSVLELYRRNLYEPEIITFDELLARAEWHVELAELES